MSTALKLKPHIGAVSAVVPPLGVLQDEANDFIKNNFSEKLSARSLNIFSKVLKHPSVLKRYFAMDNLETVLNENADKKIKRFTDSAVALSKKAIIKSLESSGLEAKDITGLVVNTCTGYICPGLSTYLIEELGLDRNIKAYDLVGTGCGGAIPNMQVSEGVLNGAENNIVLSVSVEICSSTFQVSNDTSQIISNSIFGDGAAATVLWNRPKGLRVIGSESLYLPEYREDIRFIHKDGQLHNQLSSRLPEIAGAEVSKFINSVLAKYGLKKSDINHWILHPGGEKVINSLKDKLELSEEQVAPTRAVLSKFGNMSSPTVLFILQDILDKGIKNGDYFLITAFGAGFSGHVSILQAVNN